MDHSDGCTIRCLYTFRQFKALHRVQQFHQLHRYGTDLNLKYRIKGTVFILFAYRDFYVELVEERHTGELRSITCFKTLKKLTPYLEQIDISEIKRLTSLNEWGKA